MGVRNVSKTPHLWTVRAKNNGLGQAEAMNIICSILRMPAPEYIWASILRLLYPKRGRSIFLDSSSALIIIWNEYFILY